MKKLLILLILSHAIIANCQKVFLNESKTPISDSLKAKYYKMITSDNNSNTFKEHYYFITGEKESEIQYIKKSKKNLKEGKSLTWYKNGILCSESNFSNNKLNGKVYNWQDNGKLKREIDYTEDQYNGLITTYWENGVVKRRDYFKMGKFEKGSCYDSLGNEIKHFDYEIMPEYKGGDQQLLKDISDNLVYPEKSIAAGIQGKVIVRFVVKEDGTVAKIDILQGINAELNKEAMRVVGKLNRFKPATWDGELVPVYYMIPINFTLK